MSEEAADILVIDDDRGLRDLLEIALMRAGHRVRLAASAQGGLALLRERRPNVVLTDLIMPEGSGLEVLAAVKATDPALPVIIMTAFSTWETAVEAMRGGAFDYIKKPFDTHEVRAVVQRAAQAARGGAPPGDAPQIIGSSAAIRAVLEMVRRVAHTGSTVLIQGESGTGKELVARALHQSSACAAGPFVGINCGAFAEGLLESELFGHVRGAFSGAYQDKQGLIALAHGGTLFLDEIGELPAPSQSRFLRMLQERTVLPVGGTQARSVDVRVIAATNRDLEAEVQAGRFRQDLYFRLNVIPIKLPPLRERREDIALIVGHLLARQARDLPGQPVLTLKDEARRLLEQHPWPGNIRELENVIARAVALAGNGPLGPEHLPGLASAGEARCALGPPELTPGGIDLDAEIARLERAYIEQALKLSGNKLAEAAELLGIKPRSLRYRIEKLGLSV